MHKQVVLFLLILVCSLHFSFANGKAPTALAYQGRHFIANCGQMDASIVYYADTNLGRLYIRQHDLVLQFIEPAAKTEKSKASRLDFVKQIITAIKIDQIPAK